MLAEVIYVLRTLRKDAGFTAIILLTLTLAIGGNAALLSVVDTIFFAKLPIPEHDRVLRLYSSYRQTDGSIHTVTIRGREFDILKQSAADPFSSMVAIEHEDATLTGAQIAERVNLLHTSNGWISTMGVQPIQGRWFDTNEESKGESSRVAVLSYSLSLRRFGSDSNALGKSILLNRESFSIIGVMPMGFRFPYDGDVWIPTTIPNDMSRDYCVFGRLRDGASIQHARAALDSAGKIVTRQFPDSPQGFGFATVPLVENLRGDEDKAAITLMGIAGFFLLLACVNIANLVLARSVSRHREELIRVALGATGWDEFRRRLIESLVLSISAAVMGIAMAAWLARFLIVLVPTNYSEQLGTIPDTLNWRTLFATAALGIIAGILCGVIPSFKSRRSAEQVIHESNRIGRSLRERHLMNSFVVVQFTLSLALLAGAGLLIRNFNELTHRNLGIDADHLLTMSISISGESYESAASKRNLMRSLMERVRSTPGVLEAGITTTNPLGGGTWVAPVVAAGRETNSDAATVLVNHRLVTPDLHRAMRIPLIRGRFFDERDNETSARVVIVSRLMAQKLWPKQDALNQRVRINAPGQPWLTVVGVVGDVLDSHDPDQPKETWYLPYDQFADTPAASSIFLMVRANDPASIEQSVERAIHNVDQDLAIFDISTMDRFYLEGLSQNRLSAMLISILAGFGLLLGALGIYGTLSLAVNERFREIAIRIAVGAQSNQIVRLLLTQGMKLTMFACFFGIFCAWAVGQILRNQLSLVSPFDPIALLSAALVFFIVAIISVYLPAKRATTMDPIGALRET